MIASIALVLAALADGPSAFVGMGIGTQSDNTWADAPASAALLVTAGADLSEHVGVRLFVDVPRVASSERDSTIGPDHLHDRTDHRSIAWSGFVEIHRRVAERVSVGVLGGFTYAQRPTTSVRSRDVIGAGNAVLAHTEMTTTSRYDWAGLAFGAEAPMRATNHLSIVPVGTVTLFPFAEYGRTSIARVGAETRWRF